MSHETSDLKIKSAKGSIWMAGLQVAMRPVLMVIDIVLARLLVPADYGLVAMAMILITTANLFTDLGMRQVVVQTRQDINKVTWYAFLIVMFGSTVATGLMILFAEPFTRFLGGGENLVPVLQWMSVYIVIDGLLLVPDSLLRRNLKFKQVALAQIPGILGRGLLAIPLAVMGFGVWSLVFGLLASKTIETIMYWYYERPWIWLRPQPVDREILSSMFRFGIPTTLSGALKFFQDSIDTWYVGRLLGQTVVGYYSRAFTQTTLISKMVATTLFGQVLFPSYAIMQDDLPRLKRAYLKSTRFVFLMMIPVSFGMAVVAPILIPVLYGAKWLPMVPVWQLFSLYCLVLPISANASPIFLAVGKPRNNLVASIVLLSVLIPLLLLLTPRQGMTGAALAVSIAHVVAMFFNVWQVEQILPGTAKASFSQALPFLFGGVLMSLIILGTQGMIINLAGGQNIISLLLIVTLGVLVYFGVVLLLQRELIIEVYDLFLKATNLDRRWPRLVPRSVRTGK